MNEFYEVASRFGITPQELDAGKMVVKKTGGKTVQELRNTVTMVSDEMRRIRAQSFFENIKARQRLGQGIHDRLEAYVFADGQFSDYDIAGMNKHVPIPILVTCAKQIIVEYGQCLDLTADASDWDRGKGDDLISLLNVDTLVLEQDATIRVRGNLFIVVCQHLVNHGGSIEILPTEFSYDKSYQESFHGNRGRDGCDAPAASETPEVSMESTVFGEFYLGEPLGILNGAVGKDGQNGEIGENGYCGGAIKIAEINLREITGTTPFNILVQCGCGGNGGDGGNGGRGSHGAKGGGAYRTLTEQFPAGIGGDGGNGGHGGNGGRGGNGGISSNIYVEVPSEDLVEVKVYAGLGGKGGKGGKGGACGHGGNPGGADGKDGEAGKDGIHGHSRPKAAVFICGKRIQ